MTHLLNGITTNVMGFLDLPMEILHLVFEHLDRNMSLKLREVHRRFAGAVPEAIETSLKFPRSSHIRVFPSAFLKKHFLVLIVN